MTASVQARKTDTPQYRLLALAGLLQGACALVALALLLTRLSGLGALREMLSAFPLKVYYFALGGLFACALVLLLMAALGVISLCALLKRHFAPAPARILLSVLGVLCLAGALLLQAGGLKIIQYVFSGGAATDADVSNLRFILEAAVIFMGLSGLVKLLTAFALAGRARAALSALSVLTAIFTVASGLMLRYALRAQGRLFSYTFLRLLPVTLPGSIVAPLYALFVLAALKYVSIGLFARASGRKVKTPLIALVGCLLLCAASAACLSDFVNVLGMYNLYSARISLFTLLKHLLSAAGFALLAVSLIIRARAAVMTAGALILSATRTAEALISRRFVLKSLATVYETCLPLFHALMFIALLTLALICLISKRPRRVPAIFCAALISAVLLLTLAYFIQNARFIALRQSLPAALASALTALLPPVSALLAAICAGRRE